MIIITCDRCGKDLDSDNYRNHINFNLYYQHGKSLKIEEDKDKLDLDLCESCARELSNLIDNWLKK